MFALTLSQGKVCAYILNQIICKYPFHYVFHMCVGCLHHLHLSYIAPDASLYYWLWHESNQSLPSVIKVKLCGALAFTPTYI
jgi:hypothetical protein